MKSPRVFRAVLVAAVAVGLSVSCLAASVLGIWHGHTDLSHFKISAGQNPTYAKQAVDELKTWKIVLNLKADKTYVVTTTRSSKKPRVATGPWAFKGKSVLITFHKTVDTLAVSSDGKSMVMTPSGEHGLRIVFSR
jgi:hypothetical protein